MKMDATTGLGVLVCITSQKVREKMDRKKAIKILKQRECCMECVVTDCTCNECDKAFEMAIEALEQEPCDKKGKWVFHEKSVSTGFKDLRECSYCHCYFRWEMPRNSYCPNCGAKMESEE
jgi:NADH pyrophosphatase NudC (nudix superfamily)